ncbi:class I fructose-bisphosphate aldolase [Taklimakanibacter deserti]|uniref:class I fructose-bisphosphate aldolase n=1 Tax=Taklimakanibacter deserti TaxID=2267839 RepID=UPI000E64D832
MIASYGTIRDFRSAFGPVKPILKLDLTSLTLGGQYPLTEYVMAYDLDDAERLGVKTVLNYIQLGAPFELEALRQSARLAAKCDARGFTYLCEIMPVESAMYPTPEAPEAIAAACRTGQELGAHVIKTTMPVPGEGIASAVAACDIPVVLAGGAPAKDGRAYDASIARALASGIAGVAIGRNAWGASDPAQAMQRFCRLVHATQETGEDAA